MEIPDVPKPLLEALTQAAAGMRCALVGGVVRDLLLHRHHEDPWRGLPDLDIVVEGCAADLVQSFPSALECRFGSSIPLRVQDHGAFGTFKLELELPAEFGGTWLLDVASARQETYPEPGENPKVRLASLKDDLSRRDITVNAMALDLKNGELLDPHSGRLDLASRQIRFLHLSSIKDDPTRLVRAARYAARLGFELAFESRLQVQMTLSTWPWHWQIGDAPAKSPPSLSTRLRMELELLFKSEQRLDAISTLQAWGALALFDPDIQDDKRLIRRLTWAQRLGVPFLPAFISVASEPLAVSSRLQLPCRDHKLLLQMTRLQSKLSQMPSDIDNLKPSWWCQFLEATGCSPESVALTITTGSFGWQKLLAWWLRWRHVQSPVSAEDLIKNKHFQPGKELGFELRRLRLAYIDHCEDRH